MTLVKLSTPISKLQVTPVCLHMHVCVTCTCVCDMYVHVCVHVCMCTQVHVWMCVHAWFHTGGWKTGILSPPAKILWHVHRYVRACMCVCVCVPHVDMSRQH